MIENLLWPKKLTEPPQLLVDVDTLFNATGYLHGRLVDFRCVSDINRDADFDLISIGTDGPDTFRISLKVDVTQLTRSTKIQMALAMPFQMVSIEVIGFKCNGYANNEFPVMLTPPDKTIEKTSLINQPYIVWTKIHEPPHTFLFKMESPEFEYDDYFEKQFSSGTGGQIYYKYQNSEGDLSAEPGFEDMWSNYKVIILETIIKVKVDRSYNPDTGFRIGVAEPSMNEA